jgi:signal transduction histidine kinase
MRFKTPLSIIGGYAMLLQSGGLSEEEEREYAGFFIAEETERLTELTETCCAISRLDNQRRSSRKSGRFPLTNRSGQTILSARAEMEREKTQHRRESGRSTLFGDEDLLSCVWF